MLLLLQLPAAVWCCLQQGATAATASQEAIELLKRISLVGYVLLIPATYAFARLLFALVLSLLYLVGLLTIRHTVQRTRRMRFLLGLV